MVYGDLWGCTGCGAEVVLGFRRQRLGMDMSEDERRYILNRQYVEIKR